MYIKMCITKCLFLVFINYISADQEYKPIIFSISRPENITQCTDVNYKSIGRLQEGEWVKIQATGTHPLLANGRCIFKKKEYTDQNQSQIGPPIMLNYAKNMDTKFLTSAIYQLDKNMNGAIFECSFSIKLSPNQDNQEIKCFINNFEVAEKPKENTDFTLSLAIAGGVLVFLLIIGQTIALLRCHFKSKALSGKRLEHLKSGSGSFDRDDRARYSTAPSLRGAKPPNRATADTDSHIYEFVGVNALYHGHEATAQFTDANIKNRPPLPTPEATAQFTDANIKNRPPLPTPGSPELATSAVNSPPRPPKAKSNVMASIKRLRSSSGTLKKTDVKPNLAQTSRPPKPDEKSLPESLKRPPKPMPKTGTLPKPSASDAKFLELKNALIKRNAGMFSSAGSPSGTLEKPAPGSREPTQIGTLELKDAIKKRTGGMAPSTLSPTATLEKKAPPVAPKKTFPSNSQPKTGAIKVPSNPVQAEDQPISPKPLAAVNPTVKSLVSSSLKSKIEATLKVPQPGMLPVKSQPDPPVNHSEPSPIMKNRPLLVPNIATRPLPPIQSEEVPPVAPSAIKSRPLPVPNLATRPLPPIQQEVRPLPVPNLATRPLAPIQQESEITDSDEEWDYEPLENFKIYNNDSCLYSE